MNQEKLHQAMREGESVLVATAKLRDTIIERTRRLIDGVQYVALSDLIREINEIKSLLTRLRSHGKYAVAIDARIAQSILLALLLIPERQAALKEAGKPVGLDGSAEAAAELARANDDARRIADRLWGRPNTVPTIEDWHLELSKLSDGGRLAGQLLVAPRTENAQARDSNGRTLPEVPLAPNSLPSGDSQEVELHVRTVDTETGIAIVRVMSAAHPDGPAMRGLFERRVPLAFDDERHSGVAKLLELAQATDVRIHARVGVTRGLSPAKAKHDELQLAEVLDEKETRKRIFRCLLEMNAVTEALFPERSASSAGELAPTSAGR